MEEWTQECFEDLDEAVERAEKLSGTTKYVFVIESKGKYYVENHPAMIRSWETVVAEFENGEYKGESK